MMHHLVARWSTLTNGSVMILCLILLVPVLAEEHFGNVPCSTICNSYTNEDGTWDNSHKDLLSGCKCPPEHVELTTTTVSTTTTNVSTTTTAASASPVAVAVVVLSVLSVVFAITLICVAYNRHVLRQCFRRRTLLWTTEQNGVPYRQKATFGKRGGMSGVYVETTIPEGQETHSSRDRQPLIHQQSNGHPERTS